MKRIILLISVIMALFLFTCPVSSAQEELTDEYLEDMIEDFLGDFDDRKPYKHNKPIYLGEFCWFVETDYRPDYVLKLGITHMGGGHYIVQSKLEGLEIAEEGHYEASFGTVAIVGNGVIISLTWGKPCFLC